PAPTNEKKRAANGRATETHPQKVRKTKSRQIRGGRDSALPRTMSEVLVATERAGVVLVRDATAVLESRAKGGVMDRRTVLQSLIAAVSFAAVGNQSSVDAKKEGLLVHFDENR